MIKKHILLLVTISLFSSCQEAIEKATEKIVEEKKELIGKYHTIKSENIKLFLPEEFKYISPKDYINYISKSKDTFVINAEKNRLELVKNSGRKIFFFEHFKSASIANLVTDRYIEFNNSDAKYMLQIFDKIIKDNNRPETQFDLVESQFKGNKNLRIFKAVYKIKTPKIDMNFYKYIYFISYNKKSVLVNLETPALFDFDPYIEKIRL